MAEILKQGKLPTETWFQAVCMNCKTHFKFQKKEIQSAGDQRDGYYKYINCPFCHSQVYEPKGGYEDYQDYHHNKPKPTEQYQYNDSKPG